MSNDRRPGVDLTITQQKPSTQPRQEQKTGATILAFPLARRYDLVQRQGRAIARRFPKDEDRYLAHQIAVQRRSLLAKGVDPEIVDNECAALELAILAERSRWLSNHGYTA